ncbi:putative dispersed gene family protein 1 (DGF-1), partial [Trypanosoma theileri]
MRSTAGVRPCRQCRLRRGTNVFSSKSLLLLLTVTLLLATCAWLPVAHAIPFRVQGGTIDSAIVVGRAVDSVLLDGVLISNGVSVVFDVTAMLPGAVRIELRDCVCNGGSQIYVLGFDGEPTSDRSLEVSVDRLSGRFCSLVLAHNLPPQTNVTIRDSTIVTTGPVSY